MKDNYSIEGIESMMESKRLQVQKPDEPLYPLPDDDFSGESHMVDIFEEKPVPEEIIDGDYYDPDRFKISESGRRLPTDEAGTHIHRQKDWRPHKNP